MHARFRAKHIVGSWGLDLKDAVCKAGLAGGNGVVGRVGEESTGPGSAGAEGGVHVQKGGGEERRLRAAGTGVDFEEAREVGKGVAWGERAFQRGC